MLRLVPTLVFASFGLLASTEENALAGPWKLNVAKSAGPAPSCVHDGILRIPSKIFTGSSDRKPTERLTRTSHSTECTGVYLFTPSSDGRTLTLTQPQVNLSITYVFEKQ